MHGKIEKVRNPSIGLRPLPPGDVSTPKYGLPQSKLKVKDAAREQSL